MTKVFLLSCIVLAVLSASSGYGTPAKGAARDRLKPRIFLARPQRLPGTHHKVSEERLRQIRSDLLYPFSDQGGNDGYGDYQRGIQSPTPQIQKNFTFTLPFLGLHFNYIKVSINGYLGFSDPPEEYTYPLVFPIKRWPRSVPQSDPSFIGIFYSKMRIGNDHPEDIDQRKPGVYFKLETDLQTRTDQFSVELRERLTRDIREGGVQGSENFVPKHAIITTWKNMSFAGGIDKALDTTNTFQVVLATDEVRTYAIFNYADLHWLSHTEAGGDVVSGMGGFPAFVGFNGGNGTQSFEYLPYSQSPSLLQIPKQGCGNGFSGRHIFQIDEKIILASCKNTRWHH